MVSVQKVFAAMVLVIGACLCGCAESDADACLDICSEANDQPGAGAVDCEQACQDPARGSLAASYCIDNPQACLNKAAD